MIDQEILESALQTGEVTVTFTKVSDGSERVMRCTNDYSVIKQHMPVIEEGAEPIEYKERTPKEGVISVFDLDVKQFRSFRYDTVTQVRI